MAATQTQANPMVGQYGSDNGHEFEIVETTRGEVKIRYCDDRETMWVVDTRLVSDTDGKLKLV